MKQGHFVLLFLILFIICFLRVYYEQERYDAARKEKQRIEEALETAVEHAARGLTTVMNEPEEVRKKTVETAFFEALYAKLGIWDEAEEQERMKMYIPMLVLLDEQQAFFYYAQQTENDGILELRHGWYACENLEAFGQETEAKQKGSIAEVLEQRAEEIINNHNYIAEQYGFTYTFTVPDFLQNTKEAANFPVILVVFQGWPLTTAGDMVYENCIDAGAYIQEVKKYVVELPRTLKDTHSYCHRSTCEKISAESFGTCLEFMVSKEEAIRKYGVVFCPYCMK